MHLEGGFDFNLITCDVDLGTLWMLECVLSLFVCHLQYQKPGDVMKTSCDVYQLNSSVPVVSAKVLNDVTHLLNGDSQGLSDVMECYGVYILYTSTRELRI